MDNIIIGRNAEDRKKFGEKGTVLLGKHYVTMGQVSSLSNNIYMDVVRAHVVFICGKRGGGKSYTMGSIAEGMADLAPEVRQNLSFILLDTMGIYWTMKYPNHKEASFLQTYGLEPHALDITIFTPHAFHAQYKEKGIPSDKPFSLKPSELSAADWCLTFELNINSQEGVLIEKIVSQFLEEHKNYSIEDMIKAIRDDKESDEHVKNSTINRFLGTRSWGLFDKEGTSIKDLAEPGNITVLDVSCYATVENGWKIKQLVVGLVSQKLFVERMVARKLEEYEEVHSQEDYFSSDDLSEKKQDFPLVWLVIDEAHEFLPKEGKTASSDALITILREGRQPGISLILATQQPGKIHTDVMTQSDIVLSHRITARLDTDALGMLMQSYMRDGLDVQLNQLPRVKGAALVFDDTNEKIYPMRIKPRVTWHGGESPLAIHEKKEVFDF